MTDATAVTALIEKVEGLTGALDPGVPVWDTITGVGQAWPFLWKALHGSLDAALAFVEAVLPPGFTWTIDRHSTGRAGDQPMAFVWPLDDADAMNSAEHKTPALALVLAALKALEAKGREG